MSQFGTKTRTSVTVFGRVLEFETSETVGLQGRGDPLEKLYNRQRRLRAVCMKTFDTGIVYIITCALLLRRIIFELIRKFPCFSAVKNLSPSTTI